MVNSPLQKNLFNTKYDFIIKRNYYLYLKKIRPVLKSTYGTEIPNDIKEFSFDKYESIFFFKSDNNKTIKPTENVERIINIVSTRNADFDEMTLDEILANINEALEYLLKNRGKYLDIDYDKVFSGIVSQAAVIDFRKMTHCFRHGEKDSIKERCSYTGEQKVFLINYGLSLCITLINEVSSNNKKQ